MSSPDRDEIDMIRFRDRHSDGCYFRKVEPDRCCSLVGCAGQEMGTCFGLQHVFQNMGLNSWGMRCGAVTATGTVKTCPTEMFGKILSTCKMTVAFLHIRHAKNKFLNDPCSIASQNVWVNIRRCRIENSANKLAVHTRQESDANRVVLVSTFL